jgi:hydrogenase maturation protease
VLGFGNILLSDDGAGVRLIERLRSELGAEAEFVDGGTLSFSLLLLYRGSGFDAGDRCRRTGRPPGTVSLFEGAAMDGFLTARRRTVHEVGLIDLLDMARLQDCLPAGVRCCAFSPGRIDWCEDAIGAGGAAQCPRPRGRRRSTAQRWRTP